MQPVFAAIRGSTRCSQRVARLAQLVKPRCILGTKLLLQLLPQTLRQRWTFSVGGNANLQIAALHDRTVVEVAVLEIVPGVAQNSARLRFPINSCILSGSGCRRKRQRG